MIRTRAQQLAAAARDRVEARAKSGGIPPRYRSRVAHLALWIRKHGLLQTLAFLQDKENATKREHRGGSDASPGADGQLLEDLAAVLKRGSSAGDLISAAEEAEEAEYRVLARDAIAACLWLKRCCDHFPANPGGSEKGESADDAESSS